MSLDRSLKQLMPKHFSAIAADSAADGPFSLLDSGDLPAEYAPHGRGSGGGSASAGAPPAAAVAAARRPPTGRKSVVSASSGRKSVASTAPPAAAHAPVPPSTGKKTPGLGIRGRKTGFQPKHNVKKDATGMADVDDFFRDDTDGYGSSRTPGSAFGRHVPGSRSGRRAVSRSPSPQPQTPAPVDVGGWSAPTSPAAPEPEPVSAASVKKGRAAPAAAAPSKPATGKDGKGKAAAGSAVRGRTAARARSPEPESSAESLPPTPPAQLRAKQAEKKTAAAAPAAAAAAAAAVTTEPAPAKTTKKGAASRKAARSPAPLPAPVPVSAAPEAESDSDLFAPTQPVRVTKRREPAARGKKGASAAVSSTAPTAAAAATAPEKATVGRKRKAAASQPAGGAAAAAAAAAAKRVHMTVSLDEAKKTETRSGRHVLPPLEFWRLERPLYQGGDLTAVEKVLSPVMPARKRKASASRGRAPAAAAEERGDARVDLDIVSPTSKRHSAQPLCRAPNALSFAPVSGSDGVEAAAVFAGPRFAAGMLQLASDAHFSRPAESTPQVLVVESGVASVRVADQSFKAGRGAMVHVPAKAALEIGNGGASLLRVAFVQIK